MDIFTHTRFTGHWPVGVAAVVVATSAQQALEILNAELGKLDLPADAKIEDLQCVDVHSARAIILNDGDY